MKQKTKASMIVSGGLTVLLLAAMDLVLLPAIERAAGGLRCFDLQTFGYDYDTAKTFLTALSADGRQLYQWVQIPVDTAFLIAYTVFFILALRRLFASKAVLILPALLAVADFAENTCTFLMLHDSGVLTTRTGAVFGAVTLCKTLLMYAVFLLLAVGLVRFFVQKQKKKTQKTT